MREKLERLAEAQEALTRAQAEASALKNLQHHAGFGHISTLRSVQGLTGPYDKATKISSTERTVLIAALCAHQEATESAVSSAEAALEGMLK